MPSAKTTTNPELVQQLIDIELRGFADVFDDTIARATKGRWSPVKLVEEIIRIEQADRARRSLERRTQRSRVGAFKPIADYDWNWPDEIDRHRVERALGLRFVEEGANVVLVGAHGLGKTMILKNIAHLAIQKGHTALFVPAARLLQDLCGQESTRGIDRRLRHYGGFRLLCIDEIGYLSYDSRAADLLFEVINQRYAAGKSTAITTNLAFKDWPTVFPNATCTVALIDRLTHRADIISIRGKSWRRKEADERNRAE